MNVINSTVGMGIPSVSGRDVSSSSVPSNSGGVSDGAGRAKEQAVASTPASSHVSGTSRTQGSTAAPTKEQVNQALEDMIKRQQPDPTSVQFAIDDKLNQVVIKVVDPTTNKVIKQIPAEAVMKMREDMLAMDSRTPPAGALLSEKT